jgi:hypothetical protein
VTVNDTTTKNAILSAISSAVGSGGTIVIRNSGATTLATLTALAFAAPSGGSMSFTTTASASNANSGTAFDALVKTSGGTTICTLAQAELTVTGSIVSGGTLTATSGTISL